MNKTIVAIIMGIALINLASAVTIYAGNCLEVDLSELESLDNVVYDVVGNSSDITGMNITLNETTKNVSVCFAFNFKPDNFTIIFIDNSTKEIIKEVHHYSSGGGGTKKIYVENKTIEYVEVPNYIDREIIKYINDTDTPKPIEEKSSLWNVIGLLGGLIILILSFLTINFFIKRNKNRVKKKKIKSKKQFNY